MHWTGGKATFLKKKKYANSCHTTPVGLLDKYTNLLPDLSKHEMGRPMH